MEKGSSENMARHREVFRNQRGAVLLIVAVSLIVLIGMAALAVDVGYVAVTRNELQNVADAAALAATRQIGSIYTERTPRMTYSQILSYDCTNDADLIRSAAIGVGSKNKAGGKSISVLPSDVQIGQWDLEAKHFTVTNLKPNAVRVTARRDEASGNSPIRVFFANIFTLVGASDNVADVSVTAVATAALSGQSTIVPGELDMPVGISKGWFTNFCNKDIVFYPTPDGCSGWDAYEEKTSSAEQMREIIKGLIEKQILSGNTQCTQESECFKNNKTTPPYTTPGATAGETVFNFAGGNAVAQNFDCLKNLYDCLQKDGKWEAKLPVYDLQCDKNPGQSYTVIGFATAVITQINLQPTKSISGRVVCENVEPGRGGGYYYGTYGSIPGLVAKGEGFP